MMNGIITAPRLSEEQLAAELAALTKDERLAIEADLKGTKHNEQSVSDEREKELVKRICQEIRDIPHDDKTALLEATVRCPNEFSFDRFVAFLRREFHNPKNAAKRMVVYWRKRQEVFGSKHWYLPMTQDGAMRDERCVIERAPYKILPIADSAGRAVLLFFPHYNTHEGYTVKNLKRLVWYSFECMIRENPSAATGMVNIVWYPEKNGAPIPRKIVKAWLNFEECVLPIRFAAFHHCNNTWNFRSLVKPVFMFLLNKHIRTRCINHCCDHKEYLGSLEVLYSIDSAMVSKTVNCPESRHGESWGKIRIAEQDHKKQDPAADQANEECRRYIEIMTSESNIFDFYDGPDNDSANDDHDDTMLSHVSCWMKDNKRASVIVALVGCATLYAISASCPQRNHRHSR